MTGVQSSWSLDDGSQTRDGVFSRSEKLGGLDQGSAAQAGLVCCLAGGLETGVGARNQRDGSDVTGIWLVAVPPIYRCVGVKGAEDAAVIFCHDVGILPFSPELDRWAVVRSQVSEEHWPIVHVQIDLLSVGVGADAAPHSATEVHSEDLAAG